MRMRVNRSLPLVMAALVLAMTSPLRAQLQSMPSGPGGGRMICGACTAPHGSRAVVTIAPSGEPGERIVISGRIFDADGKSPAPGVTLFVYHTDSKGHYNARDDPFQPRLHGWVRTDSNGRYEIRSIRPAPYPDRRIPSHIHVHVFGRGLPERSIPEFNFQDDPFLSAEQRALPSRLGSFSPVVALTRDADGIWHGTRDIRLGASGSQ
jgi:protocatechuate 3,4-dioxygenase beta subunit